MPTGSTEWPATSGSGCRTAPRTAPGARSDKIIYGGESPIWHPQWALEAFWNFELPRDIVEERGYPQLTEQAKRKILGENLARLHGIDVEAKKAELGVPG